MKQLFVENTKNVSSLIFTLYFRQKNPGKIRGHVGLEMQTGAVRYKWGHGPWPFNPYFLFLHFLLFSDALLWVHNNNDTGNMIRRTTKKAFQNVIPQIYGGSFRPISHENS